MTLNFRTIKYILTIAEEASFSRAAEALYISQPSLSQHIISFEKELGQKVFDRGTIPLRLTYAGERIVAAARDIQSVEDRLTHELEDIQGDIAGRIRVGATLFRGASLIPKLFSAYTKKYPLVKLELADGPNSSLLEMVANRQIDLAFVSYAAKELESVRISNSKIVLIAPASNEKCAALHEAGATSVKLSCFADEPYILLYPGHGIRKISDQIFMDNQIEPRVLYEMHSMETACHMVNEGLGFSFTVNNTLRRLDNTVEFELEGGAYEYPLYLCYKKSSGFSRAMDRFVGMAKDLQISI